MRSFRDRDYLKTPEGFIFTVIGNVHPPDRVIAYLKYIPDESGKWGRGRRRYRRALRHYNVPSVLDSMHFLRDHAPQYVFESTVYGIALPAVPIVRVAEHLCPERRLLQLQETKSHDGLETKALRLVNLLASGAEVPLESLGITGSLLPRIHVPAFSDIDLVVYGFDNAIRVRSLLQKLMRSSSGSVRRLTGAPRERWIKERVISTPLTRRNAIDVLSRKWNIGIFESTEFSVHAVRTESEVTERYGDERYVPLGIVSATARVAESTESLFMPAIYEVHSVKLKRVLPAYEVNRIVSFEGLYSDIATQGETVSCKGKLERAESSSGLHHRILVGSPEAQGTDYLLPI